MIGQIVLLTTHRGQLFQTSNGVYHLADGTTISRATYSTLSILIPSGSYSTSNNITLPDLSTGYYLRGASFQNTDYDPDVSTRSTSSGVALSTGGPGTFQTFAMKSHTHPSGNLVLQDSAQANGGPSTRTLPGSSSPTVNVISISAAVSGSSTSSVDLNHMKFYPYIKIA